MGWVMSKTRKVHILGPVCPEHGATIKTDDDQLAMIVPLKEGEPLNGREAVSVGPRNEDGSYDLTTLIEGTSPFDAPPERRPESRPTSKGPAQYATKESRESWDRIFGKKDMVN